jgi:hypothetical protein
MSWEEKLNGLNRQNACHERWTMKDILLTVQKHLSFLFQDGFQVAETVPPEGFGNWIVYLKSDKFVVKIIQDRDQISMHLAPSPKRKRGLSDLKYFDAQSVIGYLMRNVEYVFFVKPLHGIDVQLKIIAQELGRYYIEVIAFFDKSNFSLIEKDFEVFREKEREHFLGRYGYKSKMT